MNQEMPKTEGMDEKRREEMRGWLLPVLTPLLCVGVATMANPHVGFVVTITVATLIWFLVTWTGPLSRKYIQYSGYGVIVPFAIVVGLCLRYGGKKTTSGNVAPQQPIIVDATNSPGSTNVAAAQIGHLTLGDPNREKQMEELERKVDQGNKQVADLVGILQRGASSIAAREEDRLKEEYVAYAIIAILGERWTHTQYSGRFKVDWDDIRVAIDSQRTIHVFIPSFRDLKYNATITDCVMTLGAIPGAKFAGYGWGGLASLQMECLAAGSEGVYVVLGIKERSKELPHE